MGTFFWPNSANVTNTVNVNVTSATVAYTTDTVQTIVNLDTGTPSNSTPLPVRLHDPAGEEVDPASEATLQTLATENSLLALTATVATQATLQSMSDGLDNIVLAVESVGSNLMRNVIYDINGTDSLGVNADGSIDVNFAAGSAVEITDGTDTLAINADGSINAVVTATNLDIRDLNFATDSVTIGAALPAGGNSIGLIQITDNINNMSVNADGSLNVTGVGGFFESSNFPSVVATDIGTADANTLRVVVASDNPAIPTTSGPIKFLLDGSEVEVTQETGTPASSIPLPVRYLDTAGVAVDLATESTLDSIDTKTPALGQAAMAASVPVVIASNQSSVDVDVTNLPATVDTNTGNASASTIRVVLATNQPSVPTVAGGKTAVTRTRVNYVSSPVTTSAYTEIVASLGANVSEIEIFDSSGQDLLLATGAAASEVDQIYIFPGGNGRVPLSIASGTRVSIKAVSANATVGFQDINFYSA